MLTYVKRFIKSDQEKLLKQYGNKVIEINELESSLSKLPDEDLRNKTHYFKNLIQKGCSLEEIKVEAFAVVREAARRVLGQRHYDVQLIGGLALSDGNIAEMPTGEGKTLVASLPSYLHALEGKGVHVITVNDYLAQRDKELIGKVHEFLGLTVGLNIAQLSTEDKKAAYAADITYGVGNEFGFDYLRDHMVINKDDRVQRPYHFAIIDEIDSVLIDEAKTPLIIAGKTNVSSNLFNVCSKLVRRFKRDTDFLYDPQTRATSLTDTGVTKVERAFGIDNLYDLEHQLLFHYVIQSLRAHVMLKRDVDYIVSDGKIMLVDIFTGRIMEGRSYSDGLQQAIEAKEGLVITEENKTQATVTIQNYFRMYPLISGMTGTAKTEEKEFQEVYNMDVIQIPTNRPKQRVDLPDQVFETIDQKYKAVVKEVTTRHEHGQPILIGTASIEQSEIVSSYLTNAGLSHQLLNAKSVEQEAQLISLAGLKNQITIATNMAGRGTDIILGEGIAALGGLHVIGTERHDSRRVDHQLQGRAGRQGDPGSSQFFISLEDEMFIRYAEDELPKVKKSLSLTEFGLITNKNIMEFVDKTQRICEGMNHSIRNYTFKLDTVVNEQRTNMYKLRNKFLDTDRPLEIAIPILNNVVARLNKEACPKDTIPEEWNLELCDEYQQIIPQFMLTFYDVSDDIEWSDKVNEKLRAYIETLHTLQENHPINDALIHLSIISIDKLWLQHLDTMARLKEGIGLRSYAQEDPMRIYERESYELFLEMYHSIEINIAKRLKEIVTNKL